MDWRTVLEFDGPEFPTQEEIAIRFRILSMKYLGDRRKVDEIIAARELAMKETDHE